MTKPRTDLTNWFTPEQQDEFDRCFRRGRYAPRWYEAIPDIARGVGSMILAYACIFGTIFALAYVLDHVDGTTLVIFGLIGLLFLANALGLGGEK